jgi:pimeloyl-ACP methyl ester carboxylesterase
MRATRILLASVAAALLLSVVNVAAQVTRAIMSDPAPDPSNPPAMESFQIPSHGSGLNALMYIASGTGPHPVAILLHGFPGNEKNLDLAQAVRRAGWDVLYFNYRGSWGTAGDFSFTHCMEDVQSAIAYVRDAKNARALRADPARIVLLGHSMGGLMAAWATAHDPAILGAGLISGADMASRAVIPAGAPAEARTRMRAGIASALAAEGLAPLAGCTPDGLAAELMAHTQEWSLAGFAPKLAPRPVLIVNSDDGTAPSGQALAAALEAAGDKQVRTVHMATDHPYSGKRIELEETTVEWLAQFTR